MTTITDILIVCTGNICRSPLASLLLAHRLPADSTVTVGSAGTAALVGHPMPEQAARYARDAGADPSSHRGLQLTAERIGGASLVLTATREHRRAVVSLHPRASRYAFTVREFERIVSTIHDSDLDESLRTANAEDRLRTMVAVVAAHRGMAERPLDPSVDDVVDPYGLGDAVYERALQELLPGIAAAARLLDRP